MSEASRIAFRDLGFQGRWRVVDVERGDMSSLAHLPTACRWCDPPGRRRRYRAALWECMLLSGEEASDFEDPQRAWSLLEQW